MVGEALTTLGQRSARKPKEKAMSNFKDQGGNTYSSPDNKPAGHGVYVTRHDGSQGQMSGGFVVPVNK